MVLMLVPGLGGNSYVTFQLRGTFPLLKWLRDNLLTAAEGAVHTCVEMGEEGGGFVRKISCKSE